MGQGHLVVGVDGGGTKTAAVAYLVDEGGDPAAGRVLGRSVAGPSNKNSVGEAAAEAAFAQAVCAALAESGLGIDSAALAEAGGVSCLVLSMAGVDTEADEEFWRTVCSERFPSARTVVENDSVAALCSGTDGVLCGMVVISGTGSIGVGTTGASAPKLRVGGMGPLLGDGGNGYSMGLAALGAAVKAADGRGPPTPLLAKVLEKYALRNVDGLLVCEHSCDVWHPVCACILRICHSFRMHKCDRPRAYLCSRWCTCMCVCVHMHGVYAS